MKTWLPFVSPNLMSCISCSSEDWASWTWLQTQNIKKQLLLVDSSPVDNQVLCFLLSVSASQDSYRFRAVWGEGIPSEELTQLQVAVCCYCCSQLLLRSRLFWCNTEDMEGKKKKEREKHPKCLRAVSTAQLGSDSHWNTCLAASTWKIQCFIHICALVLCWSGRLHLEFL